jgi:hypothetical protein
MQLVDSDNWQILHLVDSRTWITLYSVEAIIPCRKKTDIFCLHDIYMSCMLDKVGISFDCNKDYTDTLKINQQQQLWLGSKKCMALISINIVEVKAKYKTGQPVS